MAKLPEQREHLKSILEGYNECDIFNCDETALFWKMEPRTTLARASVSGKKLLKDRVSILATCNATGEEKLPLLLINNSNNPRSLRAELIKLHLIYGIIIINPPGCNALYLKATLEGLTTCELKLFC